MRDERELKFSEVEFDDDELVSDRIYHFRDPVVERVVSQFVDRSNIGYEKYGQTLDSERRTGVKNLGDYLQDVQEELMDAIFYIQAAREEFSEAARKTTIGDLEALNELKRKMDAKKTLEEDTYRREYYGSEYTSNQT